MGIWGLIGNMKGLLNKDSIENWDKFFTLLLPFQLPNLNVTYYGGVAIIYFQRAVCIIV